MCELKMRSFERNTRGVAPTTRLHVRADRHRMQGPTREPIRVKMRAAELGSLVLFVALVLGGGLIIGFAHRPRVHGMRR